MNDLIFHLINKRTVTSPSFNKANSELEYKVVELERNASYINELFEQEKSKVFSI